MDAERHAKRTVIVTGAASGIGRATVVRLIAEGARVVAFDRSPQLDALVQDVSDADRLRTLSGDVTREDDVIRAHDLAVREFGGYGALANVAGIMDWFVPAHEVDDDTWDRVMAVNVTGPMRTTRRALRHFLDIGGGVIVNISSEAGARGAAGGFAYTAAKHAVIGQTKSVAWVYRDRSIRCNAICPGAVETGLGTSATPRSEFGLEQIRPILRLRGPSVDPALIAAQISWLFSDEAGNVNGAIIHSDGGWSAG